MEYKILWSKTYTRCHKVSFTLPRFWASVSPCIYQQSSTPRSWENLRIFGRRKRKGKPVEAASTSVRLDDIGVSLTRGQAAGTVLYTRVQTTFYFRFPLFLDAAAWHRVHDAGHLSLARACEMTFTTSAYPGPLSAGGPARRVDLSAQRGVSFDFAWRRSTPIPRASSKCKFYSMCAFVFLSHLGTINYGRNVAAVKMAERLSS